MKNIFTQVKDKWVRTNRNVAFAALRGNALIWFFLKLLLFCCPSVLPVCYLNGVFVLSQPDLL